MGRFEDNTVNKIVAWIRLEQTNLVRACAQSLKRFVDVERVVKISYSSRRVNTWYDDLVIRYFQSFTLEKRYNTDLFFAQFSLRHFLEIVVFGLFFSEQNSYDDTDFVEGQILGRKERITRPLTIQYT